MLVSYIWPNCSYPSITNNKGVDAFFVGFTIEEIKRYIPENYNAKIKSDDITPTIQYYFIIARDLSYIFPEHWYYPVSHMWNAYSPFIPIKMVIQDDNYTWYEDSLVISSLKELEYLVKTLPVENNDTPQQEIPEREKELIREIKRLRIQRNELQNTIKQWEELGDAIMKAIGKNGPLSDSDVIGEIEYLRSELSKYCFRII